MGFEKLRCANFTIQKRFLFCRPWPLTWAWTLALMWNVQLPQPSTFRLYLCRYVRRVRLFFGISMRVCVRKIQQRSGCLLPVNRNHFGRLSLVSWINVFLSFRSICFFDIVCLFFSLDSACQFYELCSVKKPNVFLSVWWSWGYDLHNKPRAIFSPSLSLCALVCMAEETKAPS